MLDRILQILLYAFFSDHLRNPHLGLDIERVRIEICNLLPPPGLLIPFPLLHDLKGLREPLWTLDHARQLWPLADGLLPQLGIAEQLQADGFGVWVAWSAPCLRGRWLTRRLLAGSSGPTSVPHMEGEHLPVSDLELLHGFRVIGEQLAVVVEVLRGLGNPGLGLHGLLERAHGGIGWDLEGEEVCIHMRGRGDGQCDPPVGNREMLDHPP